jgi:hypothetical protein
MTELTARTRYIFWPLGGDAFVYVVELIAVIDAQTKPRQKKLWRHLITDKKILFFRF